MEETVVEGSVVEEIENPETNPGKWDRFKTWCSQRPALVGAAVGSLVVAVAIAVSKSREESPEDEPDDNFEIEIES